jgi:hypothetical protein
MINLTKEQIKIALMKGEEGLKKYCWIQNSLINTDVTINQIFQKKFSNFYRIRRNAIWKQYYFSLLERAKIEKNTFEIALEEILQHTGRYESSYISKLVATINPELPVIDKFVLKNVGLKLPYAITKNRKVKIIEVYNKLIKEFEAFLKTEMGEYLVRRFTENFPWANITQTKMVDLVLWQTR